MIIDNPMLAGDYGSYEPCQPQINQNNNNNTLYSRQQPQQHPQQNQPPPQQQQSMMEQSNGSRASGSNGRSPFMVANPAYSLAPRGQQQQQQPLAYNNSSFMGSQNYSQQQQQPSSQQQQVRGQGQKVHFPKTYTKFTLKYF
jgi:hypothetical protein